MVLAFPCDYRHGIVRGSSHVGRPYGAHGQLLTELLGWNMAVSNLRWDGDYVLIDIDAARLGLCAPQAKHRG
nr:hypothetical protein [Mycobacterium leprae]